MFNQVVTRDQAKTVAGVHAMIGSARSISPASDSSADNRTRREINMLLETAGRLILARARPAPRRNAVWAPIAFLLTASVVSSALPAEASEPAGTAAERTVGSGVEASGTPRLATVSIPGDPAFVAIARDVIDIVFTIDPSTAAGAGLFDDALRVPSYDPAAVRSLVARLDQDLAAMRALPWRSWPVDEQIDFRWVYANAETARRQLLDERLYERRPASWLEPLANDLVALASYLPDDRERPARLWTQVPAMLDEVRSVATAVTARDRETARKLAEALLAMAERDGSPEARAAVPALAAYGEDLSKLSSTREFAVIGAENYAWRFSHALLLDRTPAQLLADAQREMARVDSALALLAPKVSKPAEPTPRQLEEAAALTRDGLLGLYDRVEVELRQATVAAGFVTIPDGVGPIHARETPEAIVPLSGDGGSMNPPPMFARNDIGYWNVEHFQADWPAETRLAKVVSSENWRTSRLGPYAVHEGVPGHHLQLAIARLNADPIRVILADGAQIEGWALYAEEEFANHGGFGPSDDARYGVMRSYRFRIGRVVYDVNIETGAWDLQQAADYQQRAAAGQGKVNEDILRAIQWPTQLICYFTGKTQILALKEEYRRKLGVQYSDRTFNDAFLAEGSIPVSLIRAKLLGTPVPGL
jgi:hypothetical protein